MVRGSVRCSGPLPAPFTVWVHVEPGDIEMPPLLPKPDDCDICVGEPPLSQRPDDTEEVVLNRCVLARTLAATARMLSC